MLTNGQWNDSYYNAYLFLVATDMLGLVLVLCLLGITLFGFP